MQFAAIYRGRRSCFSVFTRSQAKIRRTEHDFLLGRSWRCGGFFCFMGCCVIVAPGTRRTVSCPGCWWIPGAVPLSSRKNAKGGEQGTQLACGSNKCPLSSNAFSRAPRGSQPPKSGASVPEASSTLCTGMTGGCFCPVGTKRRGSLWKSKKYLEFFKRHCYGENLYVKTLFEK